MDIPTKDFLQINFSKKKLAKEIIEGNYISFNFDYTP